MKLISFKTEIYPSLNQISLIEQSFGVRRFVFNKTLIHLIKKYEDLKKNIKKIKKYEVMKYRSVLRKKYKDILRTAPSQIVETTMEDFQLALLSVKRGKCKEILKRTKKKSNTCRISRKNESNFHYVNSTKYLKIVRLGIIKMAESIPYCFNDNIKQVTIKKVANRYFISITMNVNESELDFYDKTGRTIAFDWGIKTYLRGFNGNKFSKIDFNRDIMDKLDNNIRRKHKKLSSCKLNSNKFYKAKTKLEQAYLNRVNYQEDFLKKLAKKLVVKYDNVILEDLNMSFILKNKKLAKKASERMYYKMKVILSRKFSQSNKSIFIVPKSFPSSQMCSKCGNVLIGMDKIKLHERTYECKKCGKKIDRDKNAAKNLYNCRELTKFEC